MSFDARRQAPGDLKIFDEDAFFGKCGKLFELLLAENKKTNLTRITDRSDFWIKHIFDSLLIARFFPEIASEHLRLADIGCGAGFPALPLAIAYPRLQITAIDSVGKKTAFVKKAAEELDLKNIGIIAGRARELNRKNEWQGRFDIITARAVSEAKNIYREVKNMLAPSGRIILYKTPEQAEKELPDIIKATAKNGGAWRATDQTELPQNSGKRLFIFSQ